ncbi:MULTISPECIES: M23 family metallopeptidase [unclassified Leifsonia]|uniref:M23 family metallopeptidase n=1 Tax=unclassified Leifsonia TaxID=2663824 RepID=UPI0008A7DA70|nr:MULTISPECIES: M23 family metallopeptidase [unclassified Leifsonia]SEI09289.1 Peptidase family M23 [Leifsonia sp. CL154]SFL84735.1 Peptidase family M23 [Leifsonia sp. CL147]
MRLTRVVERAAGGVSTFILLVLSVAGTPASAAAEWRDAGATALVDTASLRSAELPDAAPRWEWPLASPSLTAPYAAPATRYTAGHRGIDLSAVRGTPVSAPDDAVVRFAGVVVDRPVLTLDHGGGILSSYEPVVSELPMGTAVARGSVVGAVAGGGHCQAACLHVGVRVEGEYVSPLLFFARVPPAILLPLGSR